MPASIQSPADVVNLALRPIGYRLRVANLDDGSEAASQALDIYAQTRDQLLRGSDWYFAQTQIVAVLLKSAPADGYPPPTQWNPATNPILPWKYEYEYPSDCLKVRNLKATQPLLINVDPQPNLWREGHDPDLNQKVIYTNVAAANLVYTRQVTNPAEWESDFVESFATALGRRLLPVLMGAKGVELAVRAEEMAKMNAENEQG